MKKLVLLAVLFGAFYLHAESTFSRTRLTNWLEEHSLHAMSGDPKACDDYADDMQVELSADGQKGTWEVEGGKNEMCGYLKQSAAVYTVLQATTNSQFDDLRVVRKGFPWTRALVSYTQRTQVQAAGVPPMTIISDEVVELQRTLTGLKITSVKSKSTGGP